MNRNYIKGRRAEYRIKAELESQGYLTIRANGSHGFFDVVGIHKDTGFVRLIQVKSTKGRVEPLFQRFVISLVLPNCDHYTQELWVWKDAEWHSKVI